MKRFLLFAGNGVYPSGGMNDFKGDFDTVDEARLHQVPWMEWGHIYDTVNRRLVLDFEELEPWTARRLIVKMMKDGYELRVGFMYTRLQKPGVEDFGVSEDDWFALVNAGQICFSSREHDFEIWKLA